MRNLLPHLALLGANLIYGINYTIAKDVMTDGYVPPSAFILMRVSGALLLFWVVYFLTGREKIERKDFLRLFFCGVFGVAANQLLFFNGLDHTTPINASIIMTTNPILVLIASAVLLRERIRWVRIAGIIIGMGGAISLMIANLQGGQNGFGLGASTFSGDLMVFCNAASYGVYLVVATPLMQKYKPLTVITWVFTFGIFLVLPFGLREVPQIQWEMPAYIVWEIVFVIVATTFFAYLLNILALKALSPSVVSSYIYLQPVLATVFAIWLANYKVGWMQVICTLLIFVGVFLVSRPKAARAKN
ncbi:MAG: DMT family transporter [Salibacteraceae bacterium]